MRAELDGGVRDDADHGGGVPSPEAPEAFVEVGAINQPVSLLRAAEQRSDTEIMIRGSPNNRGGGKGDPMA